MLTLWYADGRDVPRTSPSEVLQLAGYSPTEVVDVTVGWTVERLAWMDDPEFRATTMLAGYGLSRAVAEGRIATPPTRLSSVATRIRSAPPDVAVVSGVRRGSRLAFAQSVGWADVLARHAKRVVVEVAELKLNSLSAADDLEGCDLGAPEIIGNVVAITQRPGDTGASPAVSRPADEIDLTIGRLVASILPEEPTLQFGPGGIGEGITRSLTKPVSIWSGLVTDAMAGLHTDGLLVGRAAAAYAWGGSAIRELAAAGRLQLQSATLTHDPSIIAKIPRFVGCNTALQVGLDGSVNVERVGSRTIAGVGGHTDFCEGATRSVGGISVIAVRSTAADGSSTIVPRVDVVSTARSAIGVVVTEYGIADLRPLNDAQRRMRLIEIAHPSHRDRLTAAS